MIRKLVRVAFYCLILFALIFFGFALAIEFGVRTVPVWPGWELDLPYRSDAPTRIGMLLAGIAVLIYMASRIRRPIAD